MNIAQKIKNYKNNLVKKKEPSSIFMDLIDDIIAEFPFRLNQKTYLLIPEQRKELMEMSYEYLLKYNKPMPISLTLNITKIMKKFNEAAESLGFIVITKMDEYLQDGLLFDLLGREYIDNKVDEKFNSSTIKKPLTLSVDNYALKPFLPAVFKNYTANRGEDKYLIETEDQLKKIMALFELPESKKINLKNEFIVQEYIKSFDGINSSIRVYTSCMGDILSSSLLVSIEKETKTRVKKFGIDIFNPCEYLTDPTSPYFLDSKNIISNAAGGGRGIHINPEISSFSADDEIFLSLHGINTDTLTLPDELIQQCKEIAMHYESKKGIVLGIDFIYSGEDNIWYYLETNRNPSVEGYKKFMNLNNYQRKDVKALMQIDSLIRIVENIMTKDNILENIRKKN